MLPDWMQIRHRTDVSVYLLSDRLLHTSNMANILCKGTEASPSIGGDMTVTACTSTSHYCLQWWQPDQSLGKAFNCNLPRMLYIPDQSSKSSSSASHHCMGRVSCQVYTHCRHSHSKRCYHVMLVHKACSWCLRQAHSSTACQHWNQHALTDPLLRWHTTTRCTQHPCQASVHLLSRQSKPSNPDKREATAQLAGHKHGLWQ